jgi:2-dehydropantoate 2-reductase
MRIAVVGAGAVGSYFGAQLAGAGHDVAFLARGKHLATMRREGLRIDSPGGRLHVRNSLFTSEAKEVGIADLILLCVKSYDTETAAQAAAAMIGERTIILSLQNGVDNPEKIIRLWGSHRTLAGVVYIGAQVSAPGVITHSAAGRIIFGQLDGNIDRPAKWVEETLAAAAIPCEISTSIQRVQWTKLLWNAPFCAISCLTRATVKEIVEFDSLRQLALDCMAEVQAAARTRGVELGAELFDETLTFSRSLGEFKPSMLQDLEAGKPLEYEAFNGIVVQLLHHAGRAAATNQFFYGTLKYLDKKIRQEAAR